MVPPLPLGQGFQWIDFIDENKSPGMKKSTQFLCLLHQGEGGWKPDEGPLQTAQFPRFSVQIIPSPTTDVVPPLPLGEGFQWIDFIYQFYIIWRVEVHRFFAFSFGEKVAESRMRG